MQVSGEATQDVWLKHNSIEAYALVLRETPLVVINARNPNVCNKYGFLVTTIRSITRSK